MDDPRDRRLAALLAVALLVVVWLAPGCGGRAPQPGDRPGPVEARSLLGTPLRRPALAPDVRAEREARLAGAMARLDERSDEAESWIWAGRRAAYLGRFREAVRLYGRALERWPDEPRLYRHRGHRHVTLRRLDDAVADLERAAALIEGTPDRVEPDGLPNARGIPTSTLHTNVWYHLGLARYLRGDFRQAAAAYERCVEAATNPDMLVAATYWHVLSLWRLGREVAARAALEPISPDLEIIENRAYHRLALLFRGDGDAAALLGEAEAAGGVELATVGYGVAAWHRHEGYPDRAQELFRRIVDAGPWAAFGAIAAEAELARGRARR